ncbi:hypothetical protein C2845_PM15G16240 [Panicum miliaceum]|uniref:Uncharacterized protein n=1 Tax=Panicum miliaceum TaxID=4540 RepID=A0A3L6Q4L1_PANMI|nr:hypothetical protein C2845_PM15G16240 [Panicum miliaceum]
MSMLLCATWHGSYLALRLVRQQGIQSPAGMHPGKDQVNPAASLRPRSAAPGMARNEAQSRRIGTARNEVRSGPESLFGWPGPEPNLGRIGLPSHLHGPERSRTFSLPERSQARRRLRREDLEAAAREATRRRREATAAATLSAAFSPVILIHRISSYASSGSRLALLLYPSCSALEQS